MIGGALSIRRSPEVVVAAQPTPHRPGPDPAPTEPAPTGPAPTDPAQAADTSLAERLRCGDEAALAALFDLYGPTVLGVARRVTGDPHAAEEAVQETFLWVWTHAERFDPGRGSMRSWLAVLTHRRAVDWVRAESARRRRELDPSGEVAVSAEDSAIEAEDGVLAERLAVRLRAAVEALPAAQRELVRMVYFEGRRVSDIAAVLGMPEGTAKTRLRSARQRLAALLGAEGLVALP